MQSVKYLLSFISICFIPVAFGQPMSNAEVIDRIVAKVGDNIILLSDIEIQKMQAEAEGYPMTMDMDCRIIEEMLYQNLLIHQAKIDSIEVDDARVNAEMEQRLRQIEQQAGGRANLEKAYGKSIAEIKLEFFDVMKERMLAQEMENEITRDVRVSPRDVERFFATIPVDSLPMVGEQVMLQQIVVYPKVSERAKSEAKDQLRRWKNDIERGSKSFEAVATMHSEDPGSRAQGGLMEASRGMMVKPFEAAALELKIGEISDVVETQFGFHIIQLLDRKGDDYTVRHILKTPEIQRADLTQAAAVIEECVARINEGEVTWNQAVSEYSEHTSSRMNLGNIVNPYTGELYWEKEMLKQVEPELYSNLQRMDVGMITEPMIYEDYEARKPGVRVIRLSEKSAPHRANLKDDFIVIKKAAENNKKEIEIEKWVKQIRPSVYIHIDQKYSFCDYIYNW